jgi:glycosyltransferase involved in cell wall biosynthesis
LNSVVTVLIPFFNRANYIKDAVESVFQQTYQNWKLLLVDDGSTDNYESEIESYKEDSRVTLINLSSNIGQSKALNEGLKIVDTPFLLQLNSDDWLEPTAIEQFVKEMESLRSDVAVISSNIRMIVEDENGNKQVLKERIGRSFNGRYEFLLANHAPFPRFYRTETLKEVRGWPVNNPYEGRYAEDLSVLYRLIERYRFHWIDQTLYNYRIHNGNLTNNRKELAEAVEWTVRDTLKRWGNHYLPIFKVCEKEGWKTVERLERNRKVLSSSEIMDQINTSLEKKLPCAVVSVGATESFVMAQYGVLSEEEFMNHPEAWIANQGIKNGFHHRGIRFPNIKARDELIDAVKKAHLIGYNMIVYDMNSGELTDKVFEAYKIYPKYVFEANIRRVIMFSQQKKFEKMLSGKKILLISSIAGEAKDALNKKWKKKLNFDIVGTIPIFEYEDIPEVKGKIAAYDFDLCLLAAGTNAVILASHIAEQYGKVAVDVGSGMKSFITDEVVEDTWLTDVIGLDRIMKM